MIFFVGDLAYSVDKKVESIQLEIMNYGPVQASFEVYEDFLSYGNGWYHLLNFIKYLKLRRVS